MTNEVIFWIWLKMRFMTNTIFSLFPQWGSKAALFSCSLFCSHNSLVRLVWLRGCHPATFCSGLGIWILHGKLLKDSVSKKITRFWGLMVIFQTYRIIFWVMPATKTFYLQLQILQCGGNLSNLGQDFNFGSGTPITLKPKASFESVSFVLWWLMPASVG